MNSEPVRGRNSSQLDETAVLWGFLLGLVVGILWWLGRVPRSGTETLAKLSSSGQKLREQVAPHDALAESLATGKAIARQHQIKPADSD